MLMSQGWIRMNSVSTFTSTRYLNPQKPENFSCCSTLMTAMQKRGVLIAPNLALELALGNGAKNTRLRRAYELKTKLKQYFATMQEQEKHPFIEWYARDHNINYSSASKLMWGYRKALIEYGAWED